MTYTHREPRYRRHQSRAAGPHAHRSDGQCHHAAGRNLSAPARLSRPGTHPARALGHHGQLLRRAHPRTLRYRFSPRLPQDQPATTRPCITTMAHSRRLGHSLPAGRSVCARFGRALPGRPTLAGDRSVSLADAGRSLHGRRAGRGGAPAVRGDRLRHRGPQSPHLWLSGPRLPDDGDARVPDGAGAASPWWRRR